MPTPSSSSGNNEASKKKQCLGWIEWFRGWFYLIYEMLFQRIMASHLDNPMPLPPINDLTCIVTGSTSGIGLEIASKARQVVKHSPRFHMKTVNLFCLQKGEPTKRGFFFLILLILQAIGTSRGSCCYGSEEYKSSSGIDPEVVDRCCRVGYYPQYRARFAEAWNARSAPLHVLINNAGIFSIREPQKFSKDGYEEHLQVNHLAPALLSVLLLPSLIRGSPSRIVNVNSIMHHVGFVDAEDMNLTSGKRKYSSVIGYSNSKLAQVMFSSVLHKRLPGESGVSVLCVSPGIVQTNVARDLPKYLQAGYRLIPYFIFNAQEGSRSTLFAATDPQISEYCELLKADEWPVCAFISQECRPANPSEEAHNLQTSYEVWEKTLEMIGLPSDAVEKLIEGEDVKCRYGQEQKSKNDDSRKLD